MGRFNWDTPKTLKFYDLKNEYLYAPRGFFDSLEKKIQAEIIKNLMCEEFVDLTKTVPDDSLKFYGKLLGYQEKAQKDILKYNIGTLSAPTGSGKTVIALSIIAQRKQKTLIVVHTKDLLNQWVKRIESFLSIQKKDIGIIADGKVSNGKITVALIQTLRKLQMMPSVGFLVIDECHKTPATTFYKTINQFMCKYILGLSATPYRNDGLEKLIFWYAGPIRHAISQKKITEKGHISNFNVKICKTDFTTKISNPADHYTKLISEIALDSERNLQIAHDVCLEANKGEFCIVLSDRKEHCKTLTELISKTIPETKMLTGDNKTKDRELIIKNLDDKKIKVLVATSALIGEGFDCKHLSALFLTIPIKFTGRLKQYIGRVLRKKDKPAIVYDYCDTNISCLYGGKNQRIKFYSVYAKGVS